MIYKIGSRLWGKFVYSVAPPARISPPRLQCRLCDKPRLREHLYCTGHGIALNIMREQAKKTSEESYNALMKLVDDAGRTGKMDAGLAAMFETMEDGLKSNPEIRDLISDAESLLAWSRHSRLLEEQA